VGQAAPTRRPWSTALRPCLTCGMVMSQAAAAGGDCGHSLGILLFAGARSAATAHAPSPSPRPRRPGPDAAKGAQGRDQDMQDQGDEGREEEIEGSGMGGLAGALEIRG
jgi:hypothetical protein